MAAGHRTDAALGSQARLDRATRYVLQAWAHRSGAHLRAYRGTAATPLVGRHG